MDFVFVIDEIAGLQPEHDTSVALMEAAQGRGHRVLVTSASELAYTDSGATARCSTVTLRPAVLHERHWIVDPEWYVLDGAHSYRLSGAAAVFMRTDPPVDADYLRATYLLDLVDPARTVMVNSPAGLRHANEKLFTLQTPDVAPPTVVTADRHDIRRVVGQWGRAVLKPTDGMAGRGVLALHPEDPNLGSILDTATDRGRIQVVVQQWITESEAGDRRVIVLDGHPIGAVRRVAPPGEFRCNMAVGAAVLADQVTERDRQICARLAPLLSEHELPFVGLDVIGGYLTEVNVTSPTGVREIDALCGTHIAALTVAWVESRFGGATAGAVP